MKKHSKSVLAYTRAELKHLLRETLFIKVTEKLNQR